MARSDIEIALGDLTRQQVDAIVNAANSSLLGGEGVDGAIHRAAGPALREACAKLGGCPTGEARITPGFRLPARWVIHTVGPIWRGGEHGEPELLARCYRTTFALAARPEYAIRTIALPAISAGAYGYPADQAALIALDEADRWQATRTPFALIRFVCFSPGMVETYRFAGREFLE